MGQTRREQIEAMLAEQPEDSFLKYALAMELDREGHSQRSLELYRGLFVESPPYVPAFFMAGQLLARLNRIDEAAQVLEQGIDQARLQGDNHAAAEMTEFRASLDDLEP